MLCIMQIEILTIFPEIFAGFLEASLVGKAIERGLLTVTTTDIRKYAKPPQYHVDDTPYGGGAGMVMRPEPLAAAIEAAKSRLPHAQVIYFSPAGEVFNQERAEELANHTDLILLCGRYEGIDERIVEQYVDREISIGDFVLMGGEVASMVLIEATLRLRPDVLGNQQSLDQESFTEDAHGRRQLEAPQYTRPAEYAGLMVPEVLLSGDHAKIENWRRQQSEARTRVRRPELLAPPPDPSQTKSKKGVL